MSNIQILASEVADQIAAGEVVERPSSVVKELVENAIDAGATRIEVVIENAGSRLVQVSDNGHGMSREDLELAPRRHATSKIRQAQDLVGVLSYGFRGEALPSIASVSKLRLQSRLENSDSGWALDVEGGKMSSSRPDGWASGTRVTVRDLFYNTPARAKFLKAAQTETQRLQQSITRLALAKPLIGFKLKSDKRELLNFSPVKSQKDRAVQVMGNSFMADSVEIFAEDSEFQLSGWVSPPNLHRANRNGQHWFVNQRHVEHRLFAYHLGQAFTGLLPAGRFAAALLFLDVPKEQLDVNVHPAKREVRFSNEKAVLDFLRRSIRDTLNKNGFESTLNIGRKGTAPAPYTAYSPPAPYIAETMGALDLQAPLVQAPHQKAGGWMPNPASAEGNPKIPVPLAQLHKTYILCQNLDGLLLVDQHAAHERVNYEKILKQFQNKTVQRQGLLLPQKLNLGAGPSETLRSWIPALDKLGLEINDMGSGDFFIASIPALLKDVKVSALIQDLLDEVTEDSAEDPDGPFVRKVIADMACKASVKANHPLTMEEMRALVSDLFACDVPWDPHGRPATAAITLDELEKHFHR